jgi:hypothetical protein
MRTYLLLCFLLENTKKKTNLLNFKPSSSISKQIKLLVFFMVLLHHILPYEKSYSLVKERLHQCPLIWANISMQCKFKCSPTPPTNMNFRHYFIVTPFKYLLMPITMVHLKNSWCGMLGNGDVPMSFGAFNQLNFHIYWFSLTFQ